MGRLRASPSRHGLAAASCTHEPSRTATNSPCHHNAEAWWRLQRCGGIFCLLHTATPGMSVVSICSPVLYNGAVPWTRGAGSEPRKVDPQRHGTKSTARYLCNVATRIPPFFWWKSGPSAFHKRHHPCSLHWIGRLDPWGGLGVQLERTGSIGGRGEATHGRDARFGRPPWEGAQHDRYGCQGCCCARWSARLYRLGGPRVKQNRTVAAWTPERQP